MANTKITQHVIADDAITTAMITDANITPAKLHGTLDLSSKTLTIPAVAIPSASTATTQSASDNSTKVATTAYVETAISNLVDSSPSSLNTLNELAAALNDDASFSSTVTASIATKLPLAGGTMTGAIAMGTAKITGLGNPTANQDAGTKTYIDTADALKLNLSGGTLTGDLILNTTTALKIPAGTTGQRPSAATAQLRWNTTDGALEVYNGSAWTAVGTGSSNKILDTFTGDNSTTDFTLSVTPANEDALIVFIDGVYQEKGDYALTNAVLALDTAPASGEKIAVHITTASVHDGTSATNQQFTATAGQTAFTLSADPKSENNTQVYINGVYQQKTDYTVSGTTLTFDTGLTVGDVVEVNAFTVATLGNTDTVSEGTTNLYHTTARARSAISVSGNALSYNSSTGVITSAYEESPAFTGTVTSAGLAVDTNTLVVDATNNRVGIGTASPASPLHVNITGAGDAVKIQGDGITDFDFVGNPPEFNLEDTSGSTNAKRARLTVDTGFVRIDGLSDDDATLNYNFLKGDLSNGNLTLSDYVQLGTISTSTSSATPLEINLGSTYADSAGSAAKAKLKIYEDSFSNIYGLGVSSGAFEYHNSYTSGKHDWYIGTDRKMRITHDGNIDLKTNNTGALVIPTGTTAQKPTGSTGSMRYNSTSSRLEAYVGSDWQNVTTTSQSLTGISGLDLWADVTGGISSTTIADLSGNSRTGTLTSTSHSGTLSGNTYMHFNASNEYLSYGDGSNIPDYAGDVTFFFVLTNTNGFATYRTLLADSSGAQGYQIIRTYGSTDDWNLYYKAGNQSVTSTNTALNTNSSINSTQIIIFSIASNGSGTIYKRTGGSEGSDTFSALSSFQAFQFASNTSSNFYIGNSSWAGEYYDGGIFAWGIIDHEITSAEKQVIYDYYAAKNIGN